MVNTSSRRSRSLSGSPVSASRLPISIESRVPSLPSRLRPASITLNTAASTSFMVRWNLRLLGVGTHEGSTTPLPCSPTSSSAAPSASYEMSAAPTSSRPKSAATTTSSVSFTMSRCASRVKGAPRWAASSASKCRAPLSTIASVSLPSAAR